MSPPAQPTRQIRALYDTGTITVYQAYSAAIALPATTNQKLSSSSSFRSSRMTWIKPSWCWMMYRSGYSYKDVNQAHILAITLTFEHFHRILSHVVLSSDEDNDTTGNHGKERVRVQWDPERTPSLERVPERRSIQIGLSPELLEGGIVRIEDVTERARMLKKTLEKEPGLGMEELLERGLVPEERVCEVPEKLRALLKITG